MNLDLFVSIINLINYLLYKCHIGSNRDYGNVNLISKIFLVQISQYKSIFFTSVCVNNTYTTFNTVTETLHYQLLKLSEDYVKINLNNMAVSGNCRALLYVLIQRDSYVSTVSYSVFEYQNRASDYEESIDSHQRIRPLYSKVNKSWPP